MTLAAYHPAWHGGLVWDDDRHVTAPGLRSWTGLFHIWTDIRATLQYYPLLHSAFWIEHRLWGDATLGYHLTNILEHVVSASLLALILRRLAIPGAYLAAAIFALHPVQVESVAWLAEQKNTLSGVFYLTAAMAYLRFDDSRARKWYAVALSAFVLALWCKTVTATLPAALLVIFWWRRGRLSWRNDVAPLAPFFVVGAAVAAITAWFELAVNNSVGPDFQFTFAQRVLIAGRSICFELGKLFWPTNLAFMYPRWTIDPAVWWQYLFPLGVLAAAAALWAFRKQSRAPLAAFLFFCGTLFPVLGFFNLYTFRYALVANHYQYLACIGPITLVAAVLWRSIARIPARAAIVALLVLLAGVTHANVRKFESSEALLLDTIEKDPASWFAYTNLGALRLDQGRTADARAYFEKALQLKPGFAVAYNDLGNTWLREGNVDEAIRNHRTAVDLDPQYAAAHNNLGIDLARTGNYAEAIASYQRALAIDSHYAMAHFNLANALVRTGDAAGAELHYRQAIALNDDFAVAHYYLGVLLIQLRRTDEAEAQLRDALRLRPSFAEGYYELGNLQLRQGHTAEAIASYTNALRLQPAYPESHGNLGAAFLQQGRVTEAIAEFQEALREKPDYAIARNNLGFALEGLGRLEEAAAQYTEALRLDPGNVKARENLARLRAKGPGK